MRPAVPETLEAGPAIEFGKFGKELCIVLPDGLGDDYAGRALRAMAGLLVHDKGRNTITVNAGAIGPEHRARQLLLLGTLDTNPVARDVLGPAARDYMRGIPAGGYRIGTRPSPYDKGRHAILALGADMDGAWAAAGIMAFSVRPEKDRLGAVRRFPVKLPEGMCWAPFEANYIGRRDAVELPPIPSPEPQGPRVPFGVRLWGSPMPTLDSYQRLIRALKPLGINTIVVQPGGWPDLPDAAERCRKALDIAYREGIFTVLYAGNEMEAHLPAPLTDNHRAIVAACDGHPGLLGWHIYNQLSSKLTPEQRKLVEDQTRWLSDLTEKPVGHEIVWGHNTADIPDDKAQLIRDCKAWGMGVIASDYAPIGGWTKDADLSRWEGRFLNLRPFGLPAEAVLQAHVPFLNPAVPTAAEVRNQFWWALAGGATGFYVETACLYTHFSFRGLLGWDLQPLPDGRFDAVGEIAAASQKLAGCIRGARIPSPEEAAATGIALAEPSKRLHLRIRALPEGDCFALLINSDLAAPASARLTVAIDGIAYEATDLLAGEMRGRLDGMRKMAVTAPPGGAVCLRLRRIR